MIPKPEMAKAKPNSQSNVRYSYKRYVTQEQMDEAIRSGMTCLENWEVKPKGKS